MGRLAGGILLLAMGGGAAAAGLPGYFEWILWKETREAGAPESAAGEFVWMSGPYPKLLDCEKERDRLADGAARSRPGATRYLAPGSVLVSSTFGPVVIRLLCVPDSVNPREDRRWWSTSGSTSR